MSALLFVKTLAAGASSVDLKQYNTNLPRTNANHEQLQQILQIVFGIAGALAVLMIIIAGLRFVTAQGNPQEVSKARNTIVYALIGLLIAVVAQGIVLFTLGKLT